MAEKKGNSPSFYVWITVVIIGVGVGLWGVVTLLVNGLGATGNSSQVPWGIFVSTYVFFVAASAGCVIVTLGYALGITRFIVVMKRTVFLAIISMLAGGVLILLDLGSPQSMIYPLLSPNPSSPLWWMGVFYFLYLMLLLIEFYLIIKNNGTKLRVLSVLTALSAVAVHSTLGGIFGLASVRTYFPQSLSPIYFILVAMVIGTALLLLVTILQYKLTKTSMSSELHGVLLDLGKVLGVVLGIAIFFTLWKDLAGMRSTIATTALAYEHIMATWWYWVLVVLIGLLIPAFLLLNRRTRNLNVVVVASLLVLIGMFTARVEFTMGGQIVPVLQNLGHLTYPLGSYSPTFVEIAVVIFAVAGAALVYSIGVKTLKLESIPQHD